MRSRFFVPSRACFRAEQRSIKKRQSGRFATFSILNGATAAAGSLPTPAPKGLQKAGSGRCGKISP